jgi:tyrosinase
MAQTRKSRKARSAGREAAIMHRDLAFEPGPTQDTAFKRADLVFEGVDHARDSYEVRVFLNNKDADEQTARSPETGYAGRFVVFGHGRCFGEQDHCEPALAAAPAQAIDPSGGHQHPLTPETRILTITEPLRRILSAPGRRLKTLTFVPVSKAPRREQRGLAPGLFKYDRVSLRTYR